MSNPGIIHEIIEQLEKANAVKIVYLGKGDEFRTVEEARHAGWYGWYIQFPDNEQDYQIDMESGYWAGNDKKAFYFAPLDSDIARLNGHKQNVITVSRTIQL